MNQLFFTLFCLMSLLMSSCKKEDQFSEVSVCESSDPMRQVKWLQQIVQGEENLNEVSVYQYKGTNIVLVQSMLSSCWGCHFYTCEGESYVRPDDWDSNSLKKLKTIWPKE